MRLENELINISQIEQVHEYSINELSREIYLFNEIDESSAGRFIKNMNYLNSINNKPITIWLSSGGGETDSGFSIYDSILLSPSKTIIIVSGYAASMATIIVQAANLRLITPNSSFLVHEASISLDENTTTATSNVKSLKEMMNRSIDIYAAKCKHSDFLKVNKTEAQVKQYLKKMIKKYGDWCMSAEDSVKYGFIDGILGKTEKYMNLNMVYSIYEDLGFDNKIQELGTVVNTENIICQ